MATYAIGDVQGCYDELRALLQRTGFDAGRDRLWLAGDPDPHRGYRYGGLGGKRGGATFGVVVGAPDARELVGWLRTRQLMHVEGRYAMVHAGLLPQWTIERALALGREGG